jgi:hypothetical protein
MSPGYLAGWPTSQCLTLLGVPRENIQYTLNAWCKFAEITWIHLLDVCLHSRGEGVI